MSSGLEFNKISAAILVAGIIAMTTGYVTNALYHPEHEPEKRGYQIEGAEIAATDSGAAVADKGPVDILAYMSTTDIAKGKSLTKKCTACHSFEQGGPNKIGPNLYGILGRNVANAGGFTYSKTLQGLGGKWGYQQLSEFLTKPKKYAPGTKMVFAGLKKPEQRANLISYLRSLGSESVAIPAYTPPAE